MTTVYADLDRIIPEEEGREDAIDAIKENVLEGMMGDTRDYDISRKGISKLMAQACSQQWNDTCSAYLGNLLPVAANEFLTDTARRKYCMMPSGSNCIWKCNPVNPTYADSPEYCDWYGLNQYSVVDGNIGDNCDALRTNQQLSCGDSLVCSAPSQKDLEFDPVIQNCLTYNSCQDFFTQLRYANDAKYDLNKPFDKRDVSVPYLPESNKPQFYPDMPVQGYYKEKDGRFCAEDINFPSVKSEIRYCCEPGNNGKGCSNSPFCRESSVKERFSNGETNIHDSDFSADNYKTEATEYYDEYNRNMLGKNTAIIEQETGVKCNCTDMGRFISCECVDKKIDIPYRSCCKCMDCTGKKNCRCCGRCIMKNRGRLKKENNKLLILVIILLVIISILIIKCKK